LEKKNIIYGNEKKLFVFILPIVAISQRSIPKDQLYENKNRKKNQETPFSKIL